MKGEIKMENTHSTFLVLKIRETKSNGETDISVDSSFDSFTDAKNYKEAKDCIERLTPFEHWTVSYKIQQIFYKSFVQTEKKSWKDLISV
tara:strand:- start:684 stop:953 length:270 start_codon:yes stop_codon:yes gene_type:complete